MSVVDYVYGLDRPLCSMSFNGIIFEEEIPGYRTLRVEGRDSFNQTIYEYSTRLNPGSKFQDWHEEPKEITVTFALVSSSAEDLRKKLDRIKGILRDEQNKEAQIIFKDEPELYYTGTVSKFAEEKLVSIENSAGQITIRCTDVRKKSVEEKQLTADAESLYQFTLDYPGERPSYPRFKVNVAADTNYIGFVDQDENILQFGSSSDVDAPKAAASTTQFDANFTASSFPSGWAANQATVGDDLITSHTIHGTISRHDTVGAYPSNYGTYDSETTGTWHGPSRTHTVGGTGAKNWKLTAKLSQWQNTPELGGINVLLHNEYFVFACKGSSHYFDKNIDLYFTAWEGSKQIPCKLSANVALLGVTSTTIAATASASGHVKWTIKKGTSIASASGSVNLSFICTTSTGDVTVTKTCHWVKQTLPATNRFDVLFDYTTFNMPKKSNNKSFVTRNLRLGFGGYYGEKRCDITCTSINLFGRKPVTNSAGKKGNGYIQWNIPSNTTVGVTSLTLTFKVTVPGTSTTTTINKTLYFNVYNVTETRKYYSQRGDLDIIVAGTNYNNDMVSIAEVHFCKSSTASTDAYCYIYLDNVRRGTIAYKCERTNDLTGTKGGTVTIEKIANKYTFTIGGKKYQYTNDNNLIATEVSFSFFKVTTQPELERNSVVTMKFLKHADNYIDGSTPVPLSSAYIPNKFTAGDEVEIDCESGTILVNGAPEYGYGALGNDWESFALKPGTNEIQCVWDQNASTAPSFDMYYREVY